LGARERRGRKTLKGREGTREGWHPTLTLFPKGDV
jgi:hypothetical protein